jgi:ABC-type lipoprotein export system ATPase subunit
MRVQSGETVAVIGPSGTGKTTLLNLMAGVVVPDAGSVQVSGEEITSLGEAARRAHRIRNIGMVFQEFELISYLDVTDNVLLPFRIDPRLQLDAAARTQAAELIDQVGLGDKARRRVTRLSQGERQRVAIARALVTGARVILADEPTGNLDPRNKEKILDILFGQVKARGVTLVAVTHDHGLLDRFDRVVEFDGLEVGS